MPSSATSARASGGGGGGGDATTRAQRPGDRSRRRVRPSNQEASRLQGRAEATASIDREEVAFGDDLTLTLEVRSDPALEIELPRTTEFDGFRLIDSGSTRTDASGVLVERRWLRLRAERAGPQTLPALEVRYRPAVAAGSKSSAASAAAAPPPPGMGEWNTLSTAPISFEVRSLLPAE